MNHHLSQNVKTQMYGITHVGMVRKMNQDSIYYNSSKGLGIVCDGIGGRNSGDVASSIAVSNLKKHFHTEPNDHSNGTKQILSAIYQAHGQIIKYGRNAPETQGMGTTLNLIRVTENDVYIANVGDSRTYLFRDRQLWQLTQDQNIAYLLEKGHIPTGYAHSSKKTSDKAIVSALGLSMGIKPEILMRKKDPKDLYITATDGLFDLVDTSEIQSTLLEFKKNIQKIPGKLAQKALEYGGQDNVTILITSFSSEMAA